MVVKLMPDKQAPSFVDDGGILSPSRGVAHRNDAFDEAAHEVLLAMQVEHFWYRGRHRFILEAVRRALGKRTDQTPALCAIDLGGGCGGWLSYLRDHAPAVFRELALSDSSRRALQLAEPVVGSFAKRYQLDLLDLPWQERWDVAFLLDVVEHIDKDVDVLVQARKCLRPGGILFLTAPALQLFWSYNDALAGHKRRYSRASLTTLAKAAGFTLERADYFMFLLSPALCLSRLIVRPPKLETAEQKVEYLRRSHRTPAEPINWMLGQVFSLEAWLARVVRFPWGTSILAVMRK